MNHGRCGADDQAGDPGARLADNGGGVAGRTRRRHLADPDHARGRRVVLWRRLPRRPAGACRGGIPRRRLRAARRLRRRAGPCAGLPARRREADLDERAQRQDRRHRPPDGRRTGKETDMSWQPTRDLVGYGANPPDPKWPDGARIAVNFVVNYEEGSEPSVQDGEGYSETGLTESHGLRQVSEGRDLAAESMFEYGSRVGFWRLMRLFQERQLPLTVFGCALALERNPLAADAIRKSGFDVCSHGW